MPIDLENLTPIASAIELVEYRREDFKFSLYTYSTGTYAEAEFQMLARQAFDVMLRRFWGVAYHPGNISQACGKWFPTGVIGVRFVTTS